MIRNSDEILLLQFENRPRIVNLGFLCRMRSDVVFDFLARDAGWKESVARLVTSVGEERRIALEQIVAIAVDQQVMMDLLFSRAGTVGERLVDRESFRITLSPEDALEILAGFNQLSHHGDFPRREAAGVERHLDRAKLRELRGEVFRCGRIEEQLGGRERTMPGAGIAVVAEIDDIVHAIKPAKMFVILENLILC